MFTVPARTKCWVRRRGETHWRRHFTAFDATFPSHGLADNGGSWTFSKDGWELKVAACFVVGPGIDREKTAKKGKEWDAWKLSHGARGIPTGRGASRRRRRR